MALTDIFILAVCLITETKLLNQNLNTGRFIMFSVITNIYNKKPKGPKLVELFTATAKLKKLL